MDRPAQNVEFLCRCSQTTWLLSEKNLPQRTKVDTKQILKEVKKHVERVPQKLHKVPTKSVDDDVGQIHGENGEMENGHFMSFLFMRLLSYNTNIAHIEGLCKFSTNPPHLLLLELALGAEGRALKLDLIVIDVGAVGERNAILVPRLAKDLFSHEHFRNLAFIVLAILADGLKVCLAALIGHVAHFHDSALYCVGGTETKGGISAALARCVVGGGEQNKCAGVHVVHLDHVEHAVKDKAEHIVVGKSDTSVALAHDDCGREVFHRGVLSVGVLLTIILSHVDRLESIVCGRFTHNPHILGKRVSCENCVETKKVLDKPPLHVVKFCGHTRSGNCWKLVKNFGVLKTCWKPGVLGFVMNCEDFVEIKIVLDFYGALC